MLQRVAFTIYNTHYSYDRAIKNSKRKPGIGEIDLIITDGKMQYDTELKPYKGNDETLLRMIAEIISDIVLNRWKYLFFLNLSFFKKTLAFFVKIMYIILVLFSKPIWLSW